ncbi:23345_t:CDS:2 [Entrophospora sp. SA101]|nr:12836_t:CDS:2 [Entrophospora sp. SA101]CAJ0625773.1 13364_t:CDS:2 [Entrophospora sp. SA101]CAJ0749293.1 24168_t:CDS:2 [Entrophospora sp. SA101]CAJ0760294.1 23345_t:CDS:2 [Entrophospora sp. SA101]CAJ0823121.1 10571_t:CDS:2 [Entrophospora sp. SA101]
MDQETAKALFEKGAFLLFLNAPKCLEFGIDHNSWKTGPKFMGVKLIPPGLHFVYYSTSDKSGSSGLRSGFFKFYEYKEVFIVEWDYIIEDIKFEDELDNDQNERLKSGAYPLVPPTNWQKWRNLTNYITPRLISMILTNKGRVTNTASSTVDEEELQQIDNISRFEKENDKILFTKIDFKRSWRPGAVGMEVTKYSQDKSWLLINLLQKVYNNDYKEVLGELQLSFVCLLMAQNYAGLIQWKNIVQLICSSKEALETYAETFYNEFFDVIQFQLEECPNDFFEDLTYENNFLIHAIKTLHSNIIDIANTMELNSLQRPKKLHALKRRLEKFRGFVNKKFNWDIVKYKNEGGIEYENYEEYTEEGEYAPVVVELP